MLDLEIKYIWSVKWTITTLVYLLIRYLPFLESVILLYRTFYFRMVTGGGKTRDGRHETLVVGVGPEAGAVAA